MSRRASRTLAAMFLPGAFALALFLGALSRSAPADARQAGATEGPADLYRRDCAVCHGSSGKGTNRGPTLQGVGRASIHYYLSTGRMPLAPVGRSQEPGRPLTPLPERTLSDRERTVQRHRPAYPPEVISALVDYTAALAGGGGPDIPHVDLSRADAAEGGKLFRLQCAACHSWSGGGGALLQREAPSVHEADPVQIAESIRVGPGAMPVFGPNALSEHQLSSIVAYVRSLGDGENQGGHPLGHLGPSAEGVVAWLVGIGFLLLASMWVGKRG